MNAALLEASTINTLLAIFGHFYSSTQRHQNDSLVSSSRGIPISAEQTKARTNFT